MLRVTVSTDCETYTAIFDHDNKQQAAESMLAKLITNHGFFPDNKLVTELPEERAVPEAYGVLLMPMTHQLEDLVKDDEACWVYVDDYVPGTIFLS